MTFIYGRLGGIALTSVAALTLAACESSGSYRVASVGAAGVAGDSNGDGVADSGSGSGSASGSSGGSGGSAGTGSGGSGSGANALGGKLLVTSGNAMIGAAGTQAGLTSNLSIPGSGVVSGTVDRVLRSTGQSLVELGNGSTLVLDGKGGRLGDVVSIDLGQGKVVGAPSGSPLIGTNVLARDPSTGRLATVSAASGGNLVSVTVPNNAGGTLLNATVPGGTNGLIQGANPTANANVNGTVNSTVGAVNATVNGVVNPQSGVTAGTNANVVTNTVNGLVNGGLQVKPKQ